MDTPALRRSLLALASVLALTFSGLASAEPPTRAARLGAIGGTVSFSPAGQPDWVQASVNRPLTTGDRLWTGADARAEVQLGGAAIRLGPLTSVTVLNLDDRITQVQLSQGVLRVRVRSLGPRQSFEVATPNLAFTLRRPGEYRIEVDPNDDATAVMVQSGEGEVYGDGASYTVDARRSYRFYGTDLSDYEVLTAWRSDELDRWSRERDRRAERSTSARYVSSEVVGYEDLDANGTWRVDVTYGNVWIPNRVAADWSPYRDGHWSWIDPWGWTWVDDAPWGYAVSHYGRWARLGSTWGWVPGPRRERAVYAPALVAFIGGGNFQLSLSVGSAMPSAVGWFPLAPREVYRPAYPVSRAYFDSINRSNAVIAPTTITNVYNTININTRTSSTAPTGMPLRYANQQVPGAVVAVPAQTFLQSLAVARAALPVAREAALSAPVAHVAPVAPVPQSVQGGARDASAKPPNRETKVVARTAPPPAPLPFAVQQQQLATRPGQPIDEAQRAQLKPAAPAVAPRVNVVVTPPAPARTALPPATAPGVRSPDARKAAAARTESAPVATPAPGATPAPAPAAAPVPAPAPDATRVPPPVRAEPARPEAAPNRPVPREPDKADSARADALKAEAARAEAARAEAARAEAARSDAARAAAGRADAEAARAAAARADAARAADAQAARARADAEKADQARAERGRADAAKAAEAQAAAARAAATQAEATRAAEAQAARARAEAGRAEQAKVERGRADAAKAEAARAEAARAEAARAEAARAQAARAEAARAEAARAEAARAEAARAKVPAARAEVPLRGTTSPDAAPPAPGRAVPPAASPRKAQASEAEGKDDKKK